MSTERVPQGLQEAFGQAVRKLREARGVSQEDFADACNLDRTSISKIERGISNPTIKTVWLLAKALGKRPSEVFAETEVALAPGRARKQK
jgi:transcriptional regulator with XRE-family HTH domain